MHNIIIEFDKMQIPFMMILWLHPISRKVSLATIGVCVFVRLLLLNEHKEDIRNGDTMG